MVYDPVAYAHEEAKKAIDKMFAEVISVRKEIATLKSATAFGVAEAMEPYPWGHSYDPSHYRSPEAARCEYTRLYEESKIIAVRNEARANRNQQAVKAAVAYLEALGVPATYRKTSSARSHKMITVDAEWKNALYQSLPQYSGFNAVEEGYKVRIKQLDEMEEKKKQAESAAIRQREADEKQNNYLKLAASNEAIHVAAVAVAFVECIDRSLEVI